MAIYEMKSWTPPVVVIDGLWSWPGAAGEEAVPFVNSVLDAIRKMIAAEVATG